LVDGEVVAVPGRSTIRASLRLEQGGNHGPHDRSVTTEAATTKDATFVAPGRAGSVVQVKARYENFIGAPGSPGEGPVHDRPEPVNGQPSARWRAPPRGRRTRPGRRARREGRMGRVSLTSAPRCSTPSPTASRRTSRCCGGRDVGERQARPRDAGCRHPLASTTSLLRRRDPLTRGRTTEIDKDTVAYHFHEPLAWWPDHPVQLPLLMAAWKIAPALAAGNCTSSAGVATPWSILKLAEVIGDVVPPACSTS